MITASAFSVMVSQAALWVLGPWVPYVAVGLAVGPLSDPTTGSMLGLGVGLVAVMACRLRRVGVYIDDGSVVVRNVLWTHHLAAPVRRQRWRSSWWAVKPVEVPVLRSEATSRRCKVFGCQDPRDWEGLCDVLVREGLMESPRSRTKRRRHERR